MTSILNPFYKHKQQSQSQLCRQKASINSGNIWTFAVSIVGTDALEVMFQNQEYQNT